MLTREEQARITAYEIASEMRKSLRKFIGEVSSKDLEIAMDSEIKSILQRAYDSRNLRVPPNELRYKIEQDTSNPNKINIILLDEQTRSVFSGLGWFNT